MAQNISPSDALLPYLMSAYPPEFRKWLQFGPSSRISITLYRIDYWCGSFPHPFDFFLDAFRDLCDPLFDVLRFDQTFVDLSIRAIPRFLLQLSVTSLSTMCQLR
jgi:hypothetical protein